MVLSLLCFDAPKLGPSYADTGGDEVGIVSRPSLSSMSPAADCSALLQILSSASLDASFVRYDLTKDLFDE